MHSPQQQVFDTIFSVSEKLGYATVDYLPGEEIGYPFVYLAEQFDEDRETKTAIFGDVSQTMHIYHTYKNRGELSQIIKNLRYKIRQLKHTKNFYITIKSTRCRIIGDGTASVPLLHAILEVDLTFN